MCHRRAHEQTSGVDGPPTLGESGRAAEWPGATRGGVGG